ncbi:hypothetical protein ILUMI_05450 [Ignelater luminosus]|uniref:Tc1-like transposase DDE domain-containing protein n=1 Tax=Ignelater luminosus TaxID=2038154 RepID=A0A8K0GDJ9_IGNLU|nr:hypothetical protein ILUMI_05450 [Ignelater luminosus]
MDRWGPFLSKTVEYGQQKIHMKLFRKSPFGENGEAVSTTVTSERYLQMLRDYVIPQLQNEREGIENMSFMQNGSLLHIYRPLKEFLTAGFQDRDISRHFVNLWPPRSPDLNPADYWLWGYLKHLVFRTRPTTLKELEDRIREQIGANQPEILNNAVYNLEEWLLIVQQQKQHLR